MFLNPDGFVLLPLRSSREYKHHDTDTELLGPRYSHTHQVIVKNTLVDAAAVAAAWALVHILIINGEGKHKSIFFKLFNSSWSLKCQNNYYKCGTNTSQASRAYNLQCSS